MSEPAGQPRRHHRAHTHGVMSGWIVRPYDLLVGGLLMRGTYRRIADGLTVGVPDGGRVLDVGTGPGRLVAEISRRRPDLTVTGIDPSADTIARARTRTADLPNAEIVLAPAEDLPMPDDSIDVVVSSLSSHHWADATLALSEQARVLRPGGRLWVIDLASHLGEDLRAHVTMAGLRLSDDDPRFSGLAGRRLVLIAARKPLAAA